MKTTTTLANGTCVTLLLCAGFSCICGCVSTATRWQQACQQDTISAYTEFLNSFPNSALTEPTDDRKYVIDAKKRLDELNDYKLIEGYKSVDLPIRFISQHPESARAKVLREEVLTQLQTARAAKIRKIKIIVDTTLAEDWQDSGKKTTLFDDDMRRSLTEALKPTGVEVMTVETDTADAELRAVSRVEYLSERYRLPYSQHAGKREPHAGASIHGELILKLANGASYARAIHDTTHPPALLKWLSGNVAGETVTRGMETAVSNLVADVFRGKDPFLRFYQEGAAFR